MLNQHLPRRHYARSFQDDFNNDQSSYIFGLLRPSWRLMAIICAASVLAIGGMIYGAGSHFAQAQSITQSTGQSGPAEQTGRRGGGAIPSNPGQVILNARQGIPVPAREGVPAVNQPAVTSGQPISNIQPASTTDLGAQPGSQGLLPVEQLRRPGDLANQVNQPNQPAQRVSLNDLNGDATQQERIRLLENEDELGIQPQLGRLAEGIVEFPEIDSLFYDARQMSLVRDFERGVLFIQPIAPPVVEVEPPEVKQPGLRVAPTGPEKNIPPTIPSERDLYLSGIAYNSPGNWTVWINGTRITPDHVPQEIFKINVSKEYVEIVWHDRQTHKIFPVRLRPNQRFNLDARLFLPG